MRLHYYSVHSTWPDIKSLAWKCIRLTWQESTKICSVILFWGIQSLGCYLDLVYPAALYELDVMKMWCCLPLCVCSPRCVSWYALLNTKQLVWLVSCGLFLVVVSSVALVQCINFQNWLSLSLSSFSWVTYWTKTWQAFVHCLNEFTASATSPRCKLLLENSNADFVILASTLDGIVIVRHEPCDEVAKRRQ